mgnify:CR=1 FL=1
MSDTVLIIGANGKTGRRVKTRLEARGVPVRAASRGTAIPFDWQRPDTWAPALEGTTRAYVTYQPDLAIAGADEAIDRLAGLAREAGLRQMVLLSGRGEPGAQRAETALQESGLGWNVVRASWFNQNFSEGYLLGSVLSGELALPAGPVAEPFIDADDIADVAVATLTDARHANRLYEVTGPRALTFAEAVDEISRAAGRTVRFRQVSAKAFADAMAGHAPPEIIDLLLDLFTVVLDGRNRATASGVEQALGRRPRDFADYAREIAATGLWRG